MLKWLIKKRNQFSVLWKRHERKTDWTPPVPSSLAYLSLFMRDCYEWESDPLWGLCDHVKSIKHMNWYVEKYSAVRGDCDDLATYTLYMLSRMGYKELYRVNLPEFRHVIGVYKNSRAFGYGGCSNKTLYQRNCNSIFDVVRMICLDKQKRAPKCKYLAERIFFDENKGEMRVSAMLKLSPRYSEVKPEQKNLSS